MNYSKEEKAMWLDDWRQSGKSAWAYAKENGLNLQTFKNWTKAEDINSSQTLTIQSGFSLINNGTINVAAGGVINGTVNGNQPVNMP